MFLDIIKDIALQLIIILKIYVMRRIRNFSRLKTFLNAHEQMTHKGKVHGHVSDLSHAFFADVRDIIYHNKIILLMIIFVIAVCINISSFVILDAILHSSNNINTCIIVSSLRSILQLLYQSSPPDGRYGPWFRKFNHWSLPSQRETFFSGHTTAVILSFLFYKNASFTLLYIDSTMLYYIMIFNIIYIISCLIILRIHYIIDVYGAIVTCLLCHYWVNSW